MGSIDIQIGSQAIEGELSRIAQRLPTALTNLLDDLASDVEVLMKDESPVRLGDLQNSITTETVSNLGTVDLAHCGARCLCDPGNTATLD